MEKMSFFFIEQSAASQQNKILWLMNEEERCIYSLRMQVRTRASQTA